MKRYSDEQLLKMTEKRLTRLIENGQIDDDDAQRWYDLKDEAETAISDFIKYELQYYM